MSRSPSDLLGDLWQDGTAIAGNSIPWDRQVTRSVEHAMWWAWTSGMSPSDAIRLETGMDFNEDEIDL